MIIFLDEGAPCLTREELKPLVEWAHGHSMYLYNQLLCGLLDDGRYEYSLLLELGYSVTDISSAPPAPQLSLEDVLDLLRPGAAA